MARHLEEDLISHSPWRISERGPWQSKDDPIFWHVDVISGGLRVARVSGVGKERALANAYLIATAPDLLEALQEISSKVDKVWLSHNMADPKVRDFGAMINQIKEIYEKVIDKIKGKKHLK